MNRVVVYETHGGPEVLEVRQVTAPHAGPGEVRVRVRAAGLNAMVGLFVAKPRDGLGVRHRAARRLRLRLCWCRGRGG